MKTHGITATYNSGCRCDDCRSAWRDYSREYKHRAGLHRPMAEYAAERRANAEARDNHGTESRYKLGCRCDVCTAGASAARRRRRAAKSGASA